jgi:squalene-hopene/tetraprenyl-beta-curcumene cyclase
MKTLVLAVLACSSLSAQGWSRQTAATYLDGRMSWWMSWPQAARDHDTFCISCHTALPYAMARPTLRGALAEQSPGAIERKLLDNVRKRVRLWKEVEPFYPDQTRGVPKTAESRGTESILNTVILAAYDASSADARLALENMWQQQLTTGEARGPGPGCSFTIRLGRVIRSTTAPRLRLSRRAHRQTMLMA